MHTPPPDDAACREASPELSRHAVPPTRPRPSEDKGVLLPSQASLDEPDTIPSNPSDIDISTLTPLAALKLLTATVDSLILQIASAPLTPPCSSPTTPLLPTLVEANTDHPPDNDASRSPTSLHHQDIPSPHKTPIGSPEAHPADPTVPIAAADSTDLRPRPDLSSRTSSAPDSDDGLAAQYRVLARKFASKAPPPIPLGAYLERLHTYCPMSTAVYLAAGSYIQRLSGQGFSSPSSHTSPERNCEAHPPPAFHVPVTPKTAHRLSLAALRVATKTLEDRSYPHARVAKVGGVSERELARLEISCAFLLDFELLVGVMEMREVARGMGRVWVEERERERIDGG
ncbi:MAG: hypothetical protein MMC23_007977 [Stictis urceolatum]|nr:hypothetical protein [Stictis urceolata]